MAFCPNCGQQLPENATICANCGASTATQAQPNAQQAQPQPAPAPAKGPKDFTASFDPKDAQDYKLMAILAYLGWLVLIPLLVSPAKDSPYVRFHVNQGIILFIASFISGLLSAVCIGVITGIICLVLTVIGIINAANGQAKELPIIGKFRIIK